VLLSVVLRVDYSIADTVFEFIIEMLVSIADAAAWTPVSAGLALVCKRAMMICFTSTSPTCGRDSSNNLLIMAQCQ